MIMLRKRPQPRPVRAHALTPDRGVPRLLAFAAMLWMAVCSPPAAAEPVDSLIVMPTPDSVASPDGTSRFVEKLSTLSGMNLTLAGTTRTGALVLALPSLTESSTLISKLRDERAVLWVDLPSSANSLQKARAKAGSTQLGQKFMVRLKDGVDADWSVLSARFSDLLGLGVTMERRIGNVWVLRLAVAQPEDKLVELAALLEQDAQVQYADAVLRRYSQSFSTPNDEYYPQQWNLSDPTSGINLSGAWSLQTGNTPVTVAVVDTGILPHPDLAGRVLPGYDFISDPERARDGNGRDANPRDEGDWMNGGDCGGYPAEDSFWHGTFVAGLIAANANNGIGIAGVDSNAMILPVRALGKCGGSDEDVFEAMLWAAGAPVGGVPPNPYPAKVINLSLGGYGGCASSIQEAVNDAMAHGAIVVVSAGNASDDVSAFAPANCSGVITVGAHNRAGERSFYSNFGRRIDISAPAGDGGSTDSAFSLSNDGKTVPGNPSYDSAVGTSFSAPLVAGTVSMIIGRNPTLTPGRIISILQGTSRSFTKASPCRLGNLCGAGMLDAGDAIASTVPGVQAAPAGTVAVIEYYDQAHDHYFMTANAAEIAALDATPMFKRTGYLFFAYPDAASAPADAQPVCRFYADSSQQIDSHFFSADAGECEFMQHRWAGVWNLETPAAFYVKVPAGGGACPDGTLPVYRFFDNRRDANQRFSIDLSIGRSMVNKAWVPDGSGRNGAAFCSPI